jgi:hypothetical protein
MMAWAEAAPGAITKPQVFLLKALTCKPFALNILPGLFVDSAPG